MPAGRVAELPDAPFALSGYRRSGPEGKAL
jgi:hypothetical protein